MAEVFIVTQGSYSDYHIVRVFSQRDLADEYVEAVNRGDPYGEAEVEVWTLDTESIAHGRLYEGFWRLRHDTQEFTEISGDIPPGEVSVSIPAPDYPYDYWIQVQSTDLDRTRKVLGERRAKYLAEQAGIT